MFEFIQACMKFIAYAEVVLVTPYVEGDRIAMCHSVHGTFFEVLCPKADTLEFTKTPRKYRLYLYWKYMAETYLCKVHEVTFGTALGKDSGWHQQQAATWATKLGYETVAI